MDKLNNNSYCYFELDRAQIKQIATRPEDYACRMAVSRKDKSQVYIEFVCRDTKKQEKPVRLRLMEFKPVPKITYLFNDKNVVELAQRIDSKCTAHIQVEKRNIQKLIVPTVDSDDYDEQDELLSIEQEQKPIIRPKTYTDNTDQARNKRIRGEVLRIMQENSSMQGLISPAEVTKKLFIEYNDQQTQLHVRQIMESICLPSMEKNNRKYILKPEWRKLEGDQVKKRVKYE